MAEFLNRGLNSKKGFILRIQEFKAGPAAGTCTPGSELVIAQNINYRGHASYLLIVEVTGSHVLQSWTLLPVCAQIRIFLNLKEYKFRANAWCFLEPLSEDVELHSHKNCTQNCFSGVMNIIKKSSVPEKYIFMFHNQSPFTWKSEY